MDKSEAGAGRSEKNSVAGSDQNGVARSEQKIRFFLYQGKPERAIEELDDCAPGARAELAAATVDAAAKSLYEREEDLSMWVEQAMSMEPARWRAHVWSWARAIAELSRRDDPKAAVLIEDLIACAPAAIQQLPVWPGGPSAKEWMGVNVSDKRGRWMAVLADLDMAGYSPGEALKKIKPSAPSPLEAKLAGRGHRIVDLLESNCLPSAWEELSREGSDQPALALATLWHVLYIYGGDPGDQEVADLAEDWVDAALRASPGVLLALAPDWDAALQELVLVPDEPRARSMLDKLAQVASAEMLSTPCGAMTIGEKFMCSGGLLGAVAADVADRARRQDFLARAAGVSPVRAIFDAKRARRRVARGSLA